MTLIPGAAGAGSAGTPFPTGRQRRGRQICERDLLDTADLAQRRRCVAHHPRFRRFVLLFFVSVAGRVAGAGFLGLAPAGAVHLLGQARASVEAHLTSPHHVPDSARWLPFPL